MSQIFATNLLHKLSVPFLMEDIFSFEVHIKGKTTDQVCDA